MCLPVFIARPEYLSRDWLTALGLGLGLVGSHSRALVATVFSNNKRAQFILTILLLPHASSASGNLSYEERLQ